MTAQLASECEIVCDRNNSVHNEQNNARKNKTQCWKSSTNFSSSPNLNGKTDNTAISNSEKSALVCWESVFKQDLISLLVEMLNKYAQQNNHILGVTIDKMKIYVGILLLTGYMNPKNIYRNVLGNQV